MAIAAYTQRMNHHKKEVDYREEARARSHVGPDSDPVSPAESRAARPVGCLSDRGALTVRIGTPGSS